MSTQDFGFPAGMDNGCGFPMESNPRGLFYYVQVQQAVEIATPAPDLRQPLVTRAVEQPATHGVHAERNQPYQNKGRNVPLSGVNQRWKVTNRSLPRSSSSSADISKETKRGQRIDAGRTKQATLRHCQDSNEKETVSTVVSDFNLQDSEARESSESVNKSVHSSQSSVSQCISCGSSVAKPRTDPDGSFAFEASSHADDEVFGFENQATQTVEIGGFAAQGEQTFEIDGFATRTQVESLQQQADVMQHTIHQMEMHLRTLCQDYP